MLASCPRCLEFFFWEVELPQLFEQTQNMAAFLLLPFSFLSCWALLCKVEYFFIPNVFIYWKLAASSYVMQIDYIKYSLIRCKTALPIKKSVQDKDDAFLV